MFTGIVETTGEIASVTPVDQGARVVIRAPAFDLSDVKVGDSVSVDGVCLTAVAVRGESFSVDVSRETLDRTAGFRPAAQVNLEKALRLSDRLGGHLVSGHVDGVGEVTRLEPAGESRLLEVRAPQALARYIAPKGSIAINGVSLTVNRVTGERFEVNLIPHTLAVTNLQALQPGGRVNLEIDLIARYLESLLGAAGN
ncbi:MAG TPA: riboflavin synthase [Burkholderiales bacterium]|jgi:riboflavin synthase